MYLPYDSYASFELAVNSEPIYRSSAVYMYACARLHIYIDYMYIPIVMCAVGYGRWEGQVMVNHGTHTTKVSWLVGHIYNRVGDQTGPSSRHYLVFTHGIIHNISCVYVEPGSKPLLLKRESPSHYIFIFMLLNSQRSINPCATFKEQTLKKNRYMY